MLGLHQPSYVEANCVAFQEIQRINIAGYRKKKKQICDITLTFRRQDFSKELSNAAFGFNLV